jgi:hypothetical protein
MEREKALWSGSHRLVADKPCQTAFSHQANTLGVHCDVTLKDLQQEVVSRMPAVEPGVDSIQERKRTRVSVEVPQTSKPGLFGRLGQAIRPTDEDLSLATTDRGRATREGCKWKIDVVAGKQ